MPLAMYAIYENDLEELMDQLKLRFPSAESPELAERVNIILSRIGDADESPRRTSELWVRDG
jgi:hypothetical protein